jgi:formylglycine-generating enzyme required for sulfatase activity
LATREAFADLAPAAIEVPRPGPGTLYVAAAPLTNAEFLELVARARLSNGPAGRYLVVNEYNPFLPVYRDRRSAELAVRDGFECHPVCGVSWQGAMLVAASAGGRLPTEAEWEWFAGCGGEAGRYPWGDAEPDPTRANYGEHVGRTSPVGSYPPNSWGLVDVAGNVAEWCQDPWPPSQRRPGELTARVVKGGSWNKPEDQLAISSRRAKWGMIGTVGIGLRLVWDGSSTEIEVSG